MLYTGSIYNDFGSPKLDWQRLTDYVEQRRAGKLPLK
jgi:hypothetical protein